MNPRRPHLEANVLPIRYHALQGCSLIKREKKKIMKFGYFKEKKNQWKKFEYVFRFKTAKQQQQKTTKTTPITKTNSKQEQ